MPATWQPRPEAERFTYNIINTQLLLFIIYLLHQKVATKCKHKTHKTHTQKYNTALRQNKISTSRYEQSLLKKLPDSKLDSSNSMPQRVYTVLTSNCHKPWSPHWPRTTSMQDWDTFACRMCSMSYYRNVGLFGTLLMMTMIMTRWSRNSIRSGASAAALRDD